MRGCLSECRIRGPGIEQSFSNRYLLRSSTLFPPSASIWTSIWKHANRMHLPTIQSGYISKLAKCVCIISVYKHRHTHIHKRVAQKIHTIRISESKLISRDGRLGADYTDEEVAGVAHVGRGEAALQRVHHHQAARGAALDEVLLHRLSRVPHHCARAGGPPSPVATRPHGSCSRSRTIMDMQQWHPLMSAEPMCAAGLFHDRADLHLSGNCCKT